MEALKARYTSTIQAFNTLERALGVVKNPKFKEVHVELRDSLIQRFEYSIDCLWKLLKDYLVYVQSVQVDPPTPKSTARACLNTGLINKKEFDLLIEIIEARNFTSHTYNNSFAELLEKSMPGYFSLMSSILERIK